MNKSFARMLLLGALCAGPLARADEPQITKIVARMIVLGAAGDPIPAQPKTLYIAGDKYARVEEELDKVAGVQRLIVTNEPECWVINQVDKTGKHLLDAGPKFVARAPIFWAGNGQPERDFQDLEFGKELTFFGEGRALELKPRTLEGRKCKAVSIKTGEHEAILLLDSETGKPLQIDLIKFGRLVSSVRYLTYEIGLPFDGSLFQPPADVKITSGA